MTLYSLTVSDASLTVAAFAECLSRRTPTAWALLPLVHEDEPPPPASEEEEPPAPVEDTVTQAASPPAVDTIRLAIVDDATGVVLGEWFGDAAHQPVQPAGRTAIVIKEPLPPWARWADGMFVTGERR